MDFQAISLGASGPTLTQQILDHIVPYAILLANYFLFRMLRSLVDRIVASSTSSYLISKDGQQKIFTGRAKLFKLFIDELISTCELCADCAELNVVYEKHGSYAYGLALFVLSYLWVESFGDAYTSPGYLAEEYFLIEGNSLLKTGDAYARFIGQSLAMPLAWRLASIYWRYKLINEHASIADVENCKSSLTTSTMNGFLIELSCCLLCRLTELVGHKLLEQRHLSQRVVSAACSFISALLVVLALESSGGYFHPILAASLEYGCQGIDLHQHALVFWLGPLLGHLLARCLFRRIEAKAPPQAQQGKQTRFVTSDTIRDIKGQIQEEVAGGRQRQVAGMNQQQANPKRVTRSNSHRKKKSD